MSLFRSHWTVEGISLNARNAAIRAAEADGEELGMWLSRLINKVSVEERQALADDEEASSGAISNASAAFSDDANTDAGLEESPDTVDEAATDETVDDSATTSPDEGLKAVEEAVQPDDETSPQTADETPDEPLEEPPEVKNKTVKMTEQNSEAVEEPSEMAAEKMSAADDKLSSIERAMLQTRPPQDV